MNYKQAMLDLARRGGGNCAPLFVPLVRSIACQIEAISPLEMVSDPTRLAKGIVELRRAAGLDILVTATPCFMEAQALGAAIDQSQWPPQLVAGNPDALGTHSDFDACFDACEILAAAMEATERLASQTSDGVAIVAALTGPATLLSQIFEGPSYSDQQREYVAAAVAALVRRLGQAGADAIVFVETASPVDAWEDLYGTVGNTAKFLKKPLIVAGAAGAQEWPRLAVSPSLVTTLSVDPADWDNVGETGAAQFVTTLGEVTAEIPLATLLDQVSDARYRLGI
jgi:acetophenone carboxylase